MRSQGGLKEVSRRSHQCGFLDVIHHNHGYAIGTAKNGNSLATRHSSDSARFSVGHYIRIHPSPGNFAEQ